MYTYIKGAFKTSVLAARIRFSRIERNCERVTGTCTRVCKDHASGDRWCATRTT